MREALDALRNIIHGESELISEGDAIRMMLDSDIARLCAEAVVTATSTLRAEWERAVQHGTEMESLYYREMARADELVEVNAGMRATLEVLADAPDGSSDDFRAQARGAIPKKKSA